MKLLLDTHAALWWWENSDSLGKRARKAIEDPENDVYFSAASTYEIHQKLRIGKLILPKNLQGEGLLQEVASEGWLPCPLHSAEAAAAASLEHPHRDPIDRILAAQSRLCGFTLLSRDAFFHDIGIDVLW